MHGKFSEAFWYNPLWMLGMLAVAGAGSMLLMDGIRGTSYSHSLLSHILRHRWLYAFIALALIVGRMLLSGF